MHVYFCRGTDFVVRVPVSSPPLAGASQEKVTGIHVAYTMDSSVSWANGLINWATPSPQGRPMSQSDFRSWTRTLKLCFFCLYVAPCEILEQRLSPGSTLHKALPRLPR